MTRDEWKWLTGLALAIVGTLTCLVFNGTLGVPILIVAGALLFVDGKNLGSSCFGRRFIDSNEDTLRAIYLFVNDQQAGPYTSEQVRTLIGSGQITNEIPAWQEGLAEWVPVGSLLDFPPAFVQPIAPPASAPSPSKQVPQNIQNHGILVGIGCLVLLVVFCFVLLLLCLPHPGPSNSANPSQLVLSQAQPGPSNPVPEIPDLPGPPVSTTSKYPALDEKNGFRDYVLGRSFSKFNASDLGTPFDAGDEHRYMLVNFDKQIGICQITNIRLDFNQGYLTGIIVCVDGEQNVEALKEAFISAYGEPEKGPTMYPSFVWDSYNVILNFQTDEDLMTGAIRGKAYFMSRSSSAEVRAIVDKKAKQSAGDAAKHL